MYFNLSGMMMNMKNEAIQLVLNPPGKTTVKTYTITA